MSAENPAQRSDPVSQKMRAPAPQPHRPAARRREVDAQMKKRPRLLVAGSFVMDLIVSVQELPGSGETILGRAFSTAPGGKGANQAIQAARLGARVDMVGRVGDDDFGRRLTASAQEAGVDVSHVAVDKSQPSAVGNVLLETDEAGKSRNRIVVIPGANMAVAPQDLAFLKDQAGAYDMVLLQHEIPAGVNLLAAEYAAAAGVPVMLNPAPAAAVPEELLKQLAYIAPNEHELESLTGISVKKNGQLDQDALSRAVKVLHDRGAKNVVVTLGSEGAAVSDGTEMIYSPCVDAIKAVDPTAAGDSFVGAFCTAVCAGADHRTALRLANCAASLTVSRMGAQPSLPWLSEVKELLDRLGGSPIDRSLLESLNGSRPGRIGDIARQSLETSKQLAGRELERFLSEMDAEAYEAAAGLIWDAQAKGGRVHVTGIGKPAHVANYIASLLSSTGTPACFLHGTEAVHGSCGQLVPGDVVVCISNSGETAEMKSTVTAIQNNGCKVIGVSGNPKSWLAERADAHIFAGVDQEGGPLNRAPRNSVLAEMLALQGLSVILQAQRGLTPQEYVRWHPGGALGALRDNER